MLRMLGFILYSVVALLIQIPQPEQPSPGNYYIVNSVPSPKGDKLAATFQDGQSNVFVTPLNGSEVQKVWLDTSSHILLPVSLDFVVEHHSWVTIYITCYQAVRSSNSTE